MTEELAKLETHNLMLEDRKRLRLTGVTDVDSFDEGAIKALQAREWTGNIRELRNVVERLIILAGNTITKEDVDLYA